MQEEFPLKKLKTLLLDVRNIYTHYKSEICYLRDIPLKYSGIKKPNLSMKKHLLANGLHSTCSLAEIYNT